MRWRPLTDFQGDADGQQDQDISKFMLHLHYS